MPRPLRSLLVLLLVGTFVAVASHAADDLTIVSTVTVNGKTTDASQFISQDRVRYSDGQTDTIMDYANGRIVYIDHKKKKYAETTVEELRAQMAELEDMLDGNPIMARMLGPDAPAEVEKLGGNRTIAGYDCIHYRVTMGPKLSFDLWVTEKLEMPISYYDARKMAYAAMGPMGARFDKLFDEMKKIKGVPLATDLSFKMMGVDVDTEQTATTVTVGDLPGDAFAIPPKYKKKKSAF